LFKWADVSLANPSPWKKSISIANKQKKGLKAAQFMQNCTWEKQVQRFLSVVENIL